MANIRHITQGVAVPSKSGQNFFIIPPHAVHKAVAVPSKSGQNSTARCSHPIQLRVRRPLKVGSKLCHTCHDRYCRALSPSPQSRVKTTLIPVTALTFDLSPSPQSRVKTLLFLWVQCFSK